MWSCVESGCAAPGARGKHAAALLAGHLYVVGGRGAGGSLPLRDFWRYSLASGEWERLEARGEAPPALLEHSAVAHRGRLYVFGGEPALSADTPLWVFHTQTQIWRKLAGSGGGASAGRRPREPRGGGPAGRRGHSAHGLTDCMLIYGGYKDLRGSTNEIWAFHYESESWQLVRAARPGPARHRHGAALLGARLYVHAGQCDLRACSDLWHFDTLSRVWTMVRPIGKLSPGPRAGHAAVRAGAHFYIFGGDTQQNTANDMWRFHFASETWERIPQSLKWPGPRVDGCALLVPGAGPLRAGPRPPSPARAEPGLLRGKLSFHVRRAARCSYSVLADKDSTESLVRHEAALAKSHSAYAIERGPADGGESPRAGDLPDGRRLARDPVSVPDFADTPPPALTPAEVTKLVYLDSEEEEEVRRRAPAPPATRVPQSTSVRFTATEEDAELSTSDYASAERVNRLSLGFSNPHYLGPDVRGLGLALTPDSGAGDIELQELGGRGPREPPAEQQLHLLLVGGKEPPHAARLQARLALWSYRLL